jgi:hypothetical protein
MTDQQIEVAEAEAIKRIFKEAYHLTEGIENREHQKAFFEAYCDWACFGVRVMQEELMKLNKRKSKKL